MYDYECDWEARERERERFSFPITKERRDLLRHVGLLNFFEEATSLRGNSTFLHQLVCHWDHAKQVFGVGPNLWYRPKEEGIYFIIVLSRRGEDWPQFLEFPISVSVDMFRYMSG